MLLASSCLFVFLTILSIKVGSRCSSAGPSCSQQHFLQRMGAESDSSVLLASGDCRAILNFVVLSTGGKERPEVGSEEREKKVGYMVKAVTAGMRRKRVSRRPGEMAKWPAPGDKKRDGLSSGRAQRTEARIPTQGPFGDGRTGGDDHAGSTGTGPATLRWIRQA
ncbi:hypothetical protein B0I37DRAFT_232502 [Chaetomium sp. MPI-CAGE-AT-0009]|nr:hypothetical protein B0I37DRAFT_232502 [Chaetomium sp. MPI-CAGE-AT-0009]